MTFDRPVLGVLLMIGFSAVAPLMDAFAKLAGQAIPVGEILAFRFGLQVATLMPVAWALGMLELPSARDGAVYVLRAALILTATGAFFTALKAIPMADAIAIFFVEPFILTLLGAALLGESIGWRRLLACAVGFAGAMLVIRPSFANFGPVALLPLVTALCFAFYMALTRGMARRLNPLAMQVWTALAASALILPLLALFEGTGDAVFDPVRPEGEYWLWLAGVGLTASVSHLFVSYALKFAPAATIAPLQYLEIVAATLLGLAIFGDLPDAQTFAGIAVIVASGLYVFMRERRMERARDRRPMPP